MGREHKSSRYKAYVEKFQYIVTDKSQQRNIEGIDAAGDMYGPSWQMAKAVGEGCVAGLAAAKYVKKRR